MRLTFYILLLLLVAGCDSKKEFHKSESIDDYISQIQAVDSYESEIKFKEIHSHPNLKKALSPKESFYRAYKRCLNLNTPDKPFRSYSSFDSVTVSKEIKDRKSLYYPIQPTHMIYFKNTKENNGRKVYITKHDKYWYFVPVVPRPEVIDDLIASTRSEFSDEQYNECNSLQ